MRTGSRNIVWQALLGAGLLLAGAGTPLHAESVRLKDGTSVEGTLVSEDDKQITLEVRFAGGTITSKRTFPKSELAEIQRPSAEQRAERELQQAYETARKHQLDPKTSLPLAHYDRVIQGVFEAFVVKYPNSPHVAEIARLSEEWQRERKEVASGKGKSRGQWMDAATAADLNAQDRASFHLQQGRAFLSQGKLDAAIQQLRRAAEAGAGSATVLAEANALQAQATQQCRSSLEQERRKTEQKLPAAESRLRYAEFSLKSAETNLNDYRRTIRSYGKRTSSQDRALERYAEHVNKAKAEFDAAQGELTALRTQVANVERQLADLKFRQAALPALPAAPAAPLVAQASPPSPLPETPRRAIEAEAPPEPPAPKPLPPAFPPDERGYDHRSMPAPPAMLRPDEIQSVLDSKVTSPVKETGADLPQYAPLKLLIDTLKGRGTPLMAVGLLIAGIGGVWLAVAGFRESFLWGMGVLCVPFVGIVFSLVHWAEARWPFLVNVGGWGLMYLGAFLHW